MKNMKKQIGLYIHIPFCKSKCYYCDFNSYDDKKETIPKYFESLNKEISYYSTKLPNYEVKSIFIGGGTPSVVDSKYIAEVLELCKKNLDIGQNAEITMEANPDSLSKEKLNVYYDSGINRLSIGLQATQNEVLKSIGRIHTIEQFEKSYANAREVGFNNINIDLMFGIPNQTIQKWNDTLENVIRLNPEHLSCYSLKIEEGTFFGEEYNNNRLNVISEDIDREMYHSCLNKLIENNYNHYEISNFAKKDFESKHNLVYWKGEEYIGIGVGAHSYFENNRYNNITDIYKYINQIENNFNQIENITHIDTNEQIVEFIILGLRLTDGIDIYEFREKFGLDIYELYKEQIEKLTKEKLLLIDERRIKLSRKGLDMANTVMIEFI